MTLLIAGLLTWCGVHLVPALATGLRASLTARLGLGPYKGCFALLIVTSVVLMVLGWRSVEPAMVYIPPAWGRYLTYVLVLLMFVLFVAAKRKTNIKRVLRHPQLTGLVLWSIGHLLANGDIRSLVLFTGLGVWAGLEMLLINRRQGSWTRPDRVPVKSDVLTVAIGMVLYGVFLLVHPYLSGVAVVRF